MAEAGTIPAWIALFMGLYSLSAAIGELARPGMWARMVAEMVERPGLRFLTGVVLIPLGAAIYLTNPWVPGDWLAVLVTVLGGLCVLEGCAMIAIGDLWMGLAGRIIASASRMWALFSAAIGIALVAVALLRL